jgi:ABC-2 type transport system ATP-binding protein
VLSGGRIVTDTTLRELRARGGPATIRCPLADPAAAADLPPALAEGFDQSAHALVARSTNLTATLGELVGWAERHHLDLAGLEIGPPTLEDAYLVAIGEPLTPEIPAHA